MGNRGRTRAKRATAPRHVHAPRGWKRLLEAGAKLWFEINVK